MIPSIHPKQYQDVKANLGWYTTIVMVVVGFLFYTFILNSSHRQVADTFFGNFQSFKIVGLGGIMVFGGFIGWLLVFVLEIHDKVYDRYFIRWRYYYDLDFILPFLTRPFTNNLSSRFFSIAQDNKDDFMKVYYHFVADYEHEHKIKENLIVRFYESVTKYWITQINEIILFFLLLMIFSYYSFFENSVLSLERIININYIIVVSFLVNRDAIRRSKKTIRKRTSDQIEDIHSTFRTELENELIKIHNKFDLIYGTS